MYQKDLCRQTVAGTLRITKWKMSHQTLRGSPCKSSAASSILRSVPATHMASSWPGDHAQLTSATKLSMQLKIWTLIIPPIHIQYQTVEIVKNIKNKWLRKPSKIKTIVFLGRDLVSSVRASLSSRTRLARFLSRQILLRVLNQA